MNILRKTIEVIKKDLRSASDCYIAMYAYN